MERNIPKKGLWAPFIYYLTGMLMDDRKTLNQKIKNKAAVNLCFTKSKIQCIMKTLQLQIPDNLDEKEVTLMLAVQLYDKGKLSLGQAADLVNMDKESFMEELGKFDVSLFGETIDDIKRDLDNA